MTTAWFALLLLSAPASGQDTLRLGTLQNAAVDRDPRAGQLQLQESATELRLRNIAAERLPLLVIRGEASHQSEVPAIPIRQPGLDAPQPPKDRYEAAVDVQQLLYDGGVLSRRRAATEAELRVQRARLAAALHALRMEVNQAFFSALLLQTRIDEATLLISDLEARLEVLRARAREGAALPGDTAVLRAEMLRAMQNRSEAAADRRAALAILRELTGHRIAEDDVLVFPDLAGDVAQLRARVDTSGTAARVHPRYAVFDAERAQLERQSLVVQARTKPQLSAFGQLAYGRPGLQQFTEEPHEYWLAGLRLRWQPWNWNTTRRDREIIRLQQEIVRTEDAAFTEQLRRDVQDDVETIARLESIVPIDEQIIALREQVERQARAQLEERVITPAEYVDIRTDLQEARLTLQRHRVELARARARYLTTLGYVPR